MGRIRLLLFSSAVLLIALTVTACGGSGSSSTSAAGGSSVDSGSGSESGSASATLVRQAEAAVADNYKGTDGPLSTKTTNPPKGKKIWVIACSMSAEGCAAPAEAAAEAAADLGWEAHLADGKLDPTVYNSLIRQAVAAGANGIILDVVDCALTKSSLEAARAAGVAIVGMYSLDCDEAAEKGAKLFDGEVLYVDGSGYKKWLTGPITKSEADYVIAKTDGKANVVMVREDDTEASKATNDGFEKWMKACSECKMTTVNITGADLLNGNLQSKVQTALAQEPAANVVFAPYDASITLGIAAGVEASGRGSEILVIGQEGLAPNIELIKSGKGQSFAAGLPAGWTGWAAIDEMVRAMNGEPSVNEGIGLQSIDKEHNIPTETPYYDGNTVNGKPKTNYKEEYKRLWGLG